MGVEGCGLCLPIPMQGTLPLRHSTIPTYLKPVYCTIKVGGCYLCTWIYKSRTLAKRVLSIPFSTYPTFISHSPFHSLAFHTHTLSISIPVTSTSPFGFRNLVTSHPQHSFPPNRHPSSWSFSAILPVTPSISKALLILLRIPLRLVV